MKYLILGSILVLAAAMSRLLPHPPNFVPIAAIALSSAVYFDKRFVLVIPLAAMLLSDLFLGFHSGMVWVYGSFGLIALIGLWLKSNKKPLPIVGAALASSVVFFVVTNFGVWLMGTMYPKTAEGLIACYVAAIPFFQNTVMGDLVYTGVLFGLFEGLQRMVKPDGEVAAIPAQK
jgi:hypothetical protein